MNTNPILHHKIVRECARLLFGYFYIGFQGMPGGDERLERIQETKGLEVKTELYGSKLTVNITLDVNKFKER